jgi:hypothetical protein
LDGNQEQVAEALGHVRWFLGAHAPVTAAE